MIQLLIISPNSSLPGSIQVLLATPDQYECHHKADAEAAVFLLNKPIFGACLLDVDLTSISAIRQIELIRAANPSIPLLVFSSNSRKEWEEEAILKGVDFVLEKPIRGALLNKILSRFDLFPKSQHPDAHSAASGSLPSPPVPPAISSQLRPLPALEILRDFSRIFSYSFNLKSFSYQFALKLREIISVNRIAIFLEHSKTSPFGAPQPRGESGLKCLCSVGIEPELFDYLTLSPHSGIGQAVLRSGQILRSNSQDSNGLFPTDPEIQREFELLGGQLAIPIVDRERAIGVAVLGDRLTGQAFSNEELQLLFHLMEELGLAIKSNLLHDQFVSNHKLISSVFSQMSSGCLVVDGNLNILHANPALLEFLKLPALPIQFSSLPRKLAGLLYESAHFGKSQDSFLYQDPDQPGRSYSISAIPFQGENTSAGAMMFVEDVTLVEAARKAELETSKLRLIAVIAEKFAHEIRNALVPINTCRQLIPERGKDEEFNKTLEQTLAHETGRISRLADHLLFLSKVEIPLTSTESLTTLLDASFTKSKTLIEGDPEMEVSSKLDSFRISCDPQSLKQAFFEILLNGLQANPEKPRINIVPVSATETGENNVTFEFRDQGSGVPGEIAAQALEPFFTTKNVGVGLGLSVARRILESHQGQLKISSRGRIVVTLPTIST